MTKEHKHAKLLRIAADNKDDKFIHAEGSIRDIYGVVLYAHKDWQEYKGPVYAYQWLYKLKGTKRKHCTQPNTDNK